jgi:glycosyltransferase involved in cell wall biosynthesis
VKLAIVVQRYGPAISGGAELHARYIAERLARHAEVEVLTTCAADYVTWRNELPEGVEAMNGVRVRRFKVRRERDPRVFGRLQDRVFDRVHSVGDELEWLDAEGPASPSLVSAIARRVGEFDHWLFFSYRYYHSFYGIRAAAARAVLVPTAERDSTIGLSIFLPMFRGVRAVMYNSPEERRLIQSASGNRDVPGVVVGVGSEVAANPQPARFRQKHHVDGPFALYIGRIDENKGCQELFEFFQAYAMSAATRLTLVLIGHPLLPIPTHPRIRHVGSVDDQDKFDALAGAELLIMPSRYESLSMVALEAWALGKPVLANGRCDVLKGQCIRSNAGLYYDSYAEFAETLAAIEKNRWLSGSLGRNGRQFFRDQYDWPVIERKYLGMFERLKTTPPPRAMPRLPGWLERRHRTVPPAHEVVARLPSGAALGDDVEATRGEIEAPGRRRA